MPSNSVNVTRYNPAAVPTRRPTGHWCATPEMNRPAGTPKPSGERLPPPWDRSTFEPSAPSSARPVDVAGLSDEALARELGRARTKLYVAERGYVPQPAKAAEARARIDAVKTELEARGLEVPPSPFGGSR